MRRQLTSTFSYYINYVFTLCMALVCIFASQSMMDKESWPYAAIFVAICILILYSLIFFRIVCFDSDNLYLSGWFVNRRIPVSSILSIEQGTFMFKPPMAFGGAYTTYKVTYLTENNKNKKFHFALDGAWINNWKLFKSKLLFKFDDIVK